MSTTGQDFQQASHQALSDFALQTALARAKSGFIDKRLRAVSAMPEFEDLCEQAAHIKDHALEHLDFYLEQYEQKVVDSGGKVHWAQDSDAACKIIVQICKQASAKIVTKGKSMMAEEIGLNSALIEAGLEPVETDLGEYILQLAEEMPSHIIAPAVHKTREQISELFFHHHQQYGCNKKLWEIPELVDEVRRILRAKFLSADVGITGANFLIAETGDNVIVTNEGNGDLTCTLPRVHIVVAGIEKVIPTLEDASLLLRVLARSATGQAMSAYTTFTVGPKRTGDADGPEQYHVVLIDNGRSEILASEYQSILRCLRCGACLNHCPVYSAIGGHSYNSVYPGPMGSVLTPLLNRLENSADLPNACTLNRRCETVCPVEIPLPELIRRLRTDQFRQRLTTKTSRFALAVWAFFAKRSSLYHKISNITIVLLYFFGKKKGYISPMPFMGSWTRHRDFPVPQEKTFMAQWKRELDRQ